MEIDWGQGAVCRGQIQSTSSRIRTGRCCSLSIARFASLPPTIARSVDADVRAALQTMAESYRTQASGIIYEKPLDYALQRALYESLKTSLTEFREKEAERVGMTTAQSCVRKIIASRHRCRARGHAHALRSFSRNSVREVFRLSYKARCNA